MWGNFGLPQIKGLCRINNASLPRFISSSLRLAPILRQLIGSFRSTESYKVDSMWCTLKLFGLMDRVILCHKTLNWAKDIEEENVMKLLKHQHIPEPLKNIGIREGSLLIKSITRTLFIIWHVKNAIFDICHSYCIIFIFIVLFVYLHYIIFIVCLCCKFFLSALYAFIVLYSFHLQVWYYFHLYCNISFALCIFSLLYCVYIFYLYLIFDKIAMQFHSIKWRTSSVFTTSTIACSSCVQLGFYHTVNDTKCRCGKVR